MKIEELKQNCTGCTACKTVCPKQCISMKADEEGFFYPVIDSDACIKCGKCDQGCHCFKPIAEEPERNSFYGYSTDEKIRTESTSGGAFSAISDVILSQNGIVYGAAMDYKSLKLVHASSDAVGLAALRKSKYLESDLGNTFSEIQKNLDEGRPVLFCGTPCQVSGLKQAIRDPNSLLTTCDFFCHGVPTQKLFKEHMAAITGNEPIRSISFRSKEDGWDGKYMRVVTNTKTYVKPHSYDAFYAGFMTHNTILRRSCYECRHREHHSSDITIADFWGYREINPALNDGKGLSMLIANTAHGNKAVQSLKNFELNPMDNRYSEYAYAPKDYSAGYSLREQFFPLAKQYGFEKAAKMTYMKGQDRQFLIYRIKKLIKRLIRVK